MTVELYEDKALMTFHYTDIDGNTTSKHVKLPWDSSWIRIIDEVGFALEGAGFLNVRERIKVRNMDAQFDKEEPKYIGLVEASERGY